MRIRALWRNSILITGMLLMVILLAGCVQVEMDIMILEDGSGNLRAALGVPEAVNRALLDQGLINPAEMFKAATRAGDPGVDNRTWTASGQIWMEAVRKFDSVDELNRILQESGFFEVFIAHRFDSPLSTGFSVFGLPDINRWTPPINISSIDLPKQPAQVTLRVQLPGTVEESNGQINADGSIQWEIVPGEKGLISAQSRTVNLGILAISLLFFVGGFVLIGIILTRHMILLKK